MNTSVLNTRGQSLAFPIVLAMFLHGGAITGLVVMQYLGNLNRDPILDVEPVEVSLQLKPKTDRKMEQKATQAPVPKGVQAPTAPAPDAPPPPKVSEMKLETPKAVENKGAPDRSAERQKLLQQLLKQQAIADAVEGAVDQAAASPDSDSTESINATGPGSLADPELAKYEAGIQQLFRDNFRPLPTLQGMSCVLSIQTDQGTGQIIRYWVSESSGNPSYDSACERSALAVKTIPLPPEKWAARYANGYRIRLKPKGS